MAYNKQTWENMVTPIDAEHMNHIEEGIEQAANTADAAKTMADAAKTAADEKQPKGDYALKSELPTVPTKLTAFENDAGFITKAASDLENYLLKSETYTREEVQQLLNAVPKFGIEVVDALPFENISDTTIYLVPGGDSENLYIEYIHVSGAWEKLGEQTVDLSSYLKKDEVSQLAISGSWNDMKDRPFSKIVREGAFSTDYDHASYGTGLDAYAENSTIVDKLLNCSLRHGEEIITATFSDDYVEHNTGLYGVFLARYVGNRSLFDSALDNTGESYCICAYYRRATGLTIDYVFNYPTSNETKHITYRYSDIEPLSDAFISTTIPVIRAAVVGQTVVVKAVDENGKPTEWEAVDMVKSWNDMEDKPFGTERVTILAEQTAVYIRGIPFVPVEGEKYIIVYNGKETEYTCKQGYYGDLYIGRFDYMDYGQGMTIGEASFIYADKSFDLILGQDHVDGATIALYQDVTNPLPDQFLPSTVPVISAATVGQTVAVKAVDENGKPTEWEAVAVGGGSGGVTVYYSDGVYLYTDEEMTVKPNKEEVAKACENGLVYVVHDTDSVSGYRCAVTNWRALADDYCASVTWIDDDGGEPVFRTNYSSEFVDDEG